MARRYIYLYLEVRYVLVAERGSPGPVVGVGHERLQETGGGGRLLCIRTGHLTGQAHQWDLVDGHALLLHTCTGRG
jgi:hypothetical protein